MSLRFRRKDNMLEKNTLYIDQVNEIYDPSLPDSQIISNLCERCDGQGKKPEWKPNDGICRRCNGTGIDKDITLGKIRRRARARDKRLDREDLELQADKIQFNEWCKENKALVDYARENMSWNDFVSGILGAETVPSLPQQKLFFNVVKEQQEEDEELANAPEVPEGYRIEVVGTVIKSWKEVNPFNPGGDFLHKIKIKSYQGWSVQGSCPKNLVADMEQGKQVSLVCNIEQSSDNPKFGYYRRPTQGKFV